MADTEIDKAKRELANLHGKMLTVFLQESNPENWPDMKTAANRGDRRWWKLNAIATGSLLQRIEDLYYGHALSADEGIDDEAELQARVAEARSEAGRLVAGLPKLKRVK